MQKVAGQSLARRRKALGVELEPAGVITVNPVQTTTYSLQASRNRITFGAATDIDTTAATGEAAVRGGTSAQYTIVNQGTLSASGVGILLSGAGSITNSGNITSANATGVAIYGVGGVINTGSITGTNATGVRLMDGGTIQNQTGGLISGGGYGIFATVGGVISNGKDSAIVGDAGIFVTGASAQLTNDGIIRGNTGDGFAADGGGSVNNESSGYITGALYGVTGASRVTNAGTIFGGTGGVSWGGVGLMDNFASGQIVGGTGVEVVGVGSLSNAGTIRGVAPAGVGVVFYHAGTLSGLGGSIYGKLDGVKFRASGGTFVNSGAVSSYYTGVELSSTGKINNKAGGVISGQKQGITLYDATNVTITNAGTISTSGTGATNAGIGFSSAIGDPLIDITNLAGGVISGGEGVSFGAAGNLTNAGQVNGLAVGVELDGGKLTNESNGKITGSAAVEGSGVIVNSGTISANGDGLLINAASTVTNQKGGVISGFAGAVFLVDDTLTNVGSVTATGTKSFGVLLEAGGTVKNQAGGYIGATGVSGYAVTIINGVGSVANAGTLKSVQSLAVVLTDGGTVTNSGSVSAATYGVVIQGGVGQMTNTGHISASLTNAKSVGVVLKGGGTVTNWATGNITVGGAAIFSATDAISVVNAGHLKGAIGAGVDLTAGGSVTNSAGGSIIGKYYGVEISGGAGRVVDAGAIQGSKGSVAFTGGGANSLTLQTGATLTGPVIGSTASGATNALVLQGAGESDNTFEHFNTLNMQGPGTWTLGRSSAIGAVTVSKGVLDVTGGLTGAFTVKAGATLEGTGASLRGNIADSGTVAFDQTADGAFFRAITGAGTLIKQGAGTLVLDAAASIKTTTVAAGTLKVGDTHHTLVSLTSNSITVDAGASLTGSGLIVGNLTDNGTVQLSHSQTLGRTLSGVGVVSAAGGADVVLGGHGAAFSGQALIGAGTIELASADALGTGSVVFAAGSAAQTLRIDAAAAPASGGTFANTISDFSGATDSIDLRSIAFVTGAKATVSGSVLTLSDHGQSYNFQLAGSVAASFTVAKDGHGGTLIEAQVASFAQAAAGVTTAGATLIASATSGEPGGQASMLRLAEPVGGRG